MLKKIKTTKKVDFFELVKGVQTGIYKHGNYRVVGGNEGSVWVDLGGFILEEPDNKILFTDSFTVEVEVPIDENTRFSFLFEIDEDNFVHTVEDITISKMICSDTKRIYAPLNCKLELVWERDGE